MNKRSQGRIQESERGQSLVEFALMFVVLSLTLMGILDLGRLYYVFVGLQDAVGEGAQYATMNLTNASCAYNTPGSPCADPDNVTWRTKYANPSGAINPDLVDVQVGFGTADLVSHAIPVTVTATYSYTLLTPVIQSIVGSSVLPLRAQSATFLGLP